MWDSINLALQAAWVFITDTSAVELATYTALALMSGRCVWNHRGQIVYPVVWLFAPEPLPPERQPDEFLADILALLHEADGVWDEKTGELVVNGLEVMRAPDTSVIRSVVIDTANVWTDLDEWEKQQVITAVSKAIDTIKSRGRAERREKSHSKLPRPLRVVEKARKKESA